MFCIVVWYSDRSGITMVLGPWRDREDAVNAGATLEAFAIDKIFEIRPMASVILPATVE